MQKVLVLTVAAAVFMTAALSVMLMASSSLGSFGETINKESESSVCQVEIDRAEETGQWNRVSDNCLTSEQIPEDSQDDALAARYRQDLVVE